jgi:hypothetical protein
MDPARRARLSGAAILAATVLLPLVGAWLSGRDVSGVFAFPPPLAIPTDYPRFSWLALVLVLAPFVALAVAWLRPGRRAKPGLDGALQHRTATAARPKPFPRWGWIGVAWTIGWWVLAWNRFNWFVPVQRFTFFPLWLGFVVTVNALTMRVGGNCLLVRRPGAWLGLFLSSAAFWWVFEWLNRFSHNWHYLGVADFGPLAYAFHATLCFSTVLPAVAAVAELLRAAPRFQRGCAAGPRLGWFADRRTGLALLAAGIAALIGTGLLPLRFYAALWAAPLALLLADDVLSRRGLPMEVAAGDWRRVATWSLAALICGFFWELWNVHSAAKWIYTVPFADRWHIFEMPLLGYTGYLPFGLECYLVAARVLGPERLFSSASST